MHFRKILAFLFLLNSVSLFIYFSSNSTSQSPKIRRNQSIPPPIFLFPPQFSKPWPLLPSHLPWSQSPNAKFRSCEAYFRNGFTQVVDVAKNSGGGWFRCHYSATLRSSVCEGGRIRMDPGKIKMSRGGEKLQEVIGRKKEEEMPEFEIGAFQLETGAGTKGSRLVSVIWVRETQIRSGFKNSDSIWVRETHIDSGFHELDRFRKWDGARTKRI